VMSKLERFEKFASLASRWLNWVTVVGFVAMTLATVIDVFAAKVIRIPVLWSYDITGLLGLVVLVFALAYTQFLRGHIEIEFVSARLPVRVQGIFDIIVALLGMALFAFMTWQMLDFAMTLQRTGRITSIAEIPLSPFAYGAAFCFLAVFMILLLQLFKAITEVSRR